MTRTQLDILEQAIPEFIVNLKKYGTTSKALEALKRTFKSNNITIQDWNVVLEVIGQQSDIFNAFSDATSMEETLATVLEKVTAAIEEAQTDLATLDDDKASRAENALKVDKITTLGNHVYAHEGTTQTEYAVDAGSSPNAIVKRTETGSISVPVTPTADNDATSKDYVDSENATQVNEYHGLYNANEERIATLEGKVPNQASDTNQLADKEFVNSSIATNTATFRGTLNIVDDLGLTSEATEQQISAAIASYLTEHSVSFDINDYCNVGYPVPGATPSAYTRIDRYKYGTVWAFEFTVNNSSFTAAQWAAINSGATVELINTIPTLVAGKQNKVTYSLTEPENPQDNDIWVKDSADNTIQYEGERGVSVNQNTAKIGLNLSELLNFIYPIGSIYLSTNNVSPATFLGGTWEQIKDKFLLTAGDTYQAGVTGGYAEYTLTTDNLPEHAHDFAVTGDFDTNNKRARIELNLDGDIFYSDAVVSTGDGYSGHYKISTTYQASSGGALYTASHKHTVSMNYTSTTSNAGQDVSTITPVPTMPPYLTVYAWKRTA